MKDLKPKPWLLLVITVVYLVEAKSKVCPDELPIEGKEFCFGPQYSQYKMWNLANDTCKSIGKEGSLANMIDPDAMDALKESVASNLKERTKDKALWIGMTAEPPPMFGEKRDSDEKRWIFDKDDSKIAEKDFQFWSDQPEDRKSCAVISGRKDFLVTATNCGGELFVVCEKKKEPCDHDHKFYYMFNGMCVAVVPEQVKRNEYGRKCGDEGVPAFYKDDDGRKAITTAVKNAFLGGSFLYVGAREKDGVWQFPDGSPVEEDLWEEGEPRQWKCAGLVLQDNGDLKLKSVNCQLLSNFLCSSKKLSGGDGGGET